MKIRLLSFLTLVCSLLFTQFSEPIRINQELSSVYFRGEESWQLTDNGIYHTMIRNYPNELYLSHSDNGEEFSFTLIDENVITSPLALPTLAVFPNGSITVFYMKQVENEHTLFKAISEDNGSTFQIESIVSNVSWFSTHLDGEELYLVYNSFIEDEHSFAQFSYFSDTEESENADGGFDATIIPFMGYDDINGYVHSNSDIWVRQGGGGTNNGWPLFHDMVTTSGRFMIYPTGMPISNMPGLAEQIFQGGYAEDVINIDLPTDAEELIANAIQVGSGYDIVYVKMEGVACQIMLGEITEPETQQFEVYSWYPHNEEITNDIINSSGNWYEESDLIYQNQIDISDTIWVAGPSYNLFGNTFWVEDAELWIEGEVWGNVVWGCANNVYITSDITYTCTPVGDYPDGFSGYDANGQPLYENPVNYTDYFGLVSEEKIILKYKHKDPFNNMQIRNDNCNDVNLYGVYAAIGKGDESLHGIMACHYDGLFTFEYQHPHGSTPNFSAPSPYTSIDTLYSYLDFHKFIFPIDSLISPELHGFNLHSNDIYNNGTSGFPFESDEYLNSYPNNDPANYSYPYGTDYPWYNPVWPESAEEIVLNRGHLNLWGSLIQRRRGFIRRSGYDSYNHPIENSNFTNVWDLENYHYGGMHNPTGYYRDYYYDTRFSDDPPIDFLTCVTGIFNPIMVIAKSDDGCATFETLLTSDLADYEYANDIRAKDGLIAVTTSKNDSVSIIYSTNHGEDFSEISLELSPGKLRKMLIEDDLVYFLTSYADTLDNNYIDVFDPVTSQVSLFQSFEPASDVSNFTITNNQKKMYVFNQEDFANIDIEFRYTDNNGSNFSEVYVWDTNMMFSSIMNHDGSDVSLDFNYQDEVYVTIEDAFSGKCNLWFSIGSLPNLTGSEQFEIPNYSFQISNLANYPNPFNPSTTISFNFSNEQDEQTELVIYNLKGQKVKIFPVILSGVEGSGENEYSVIWNGKDDSDKPVSSGIYFYKLKSGDFQKTKKMLLMK